MKAKTRITEIFGELYAKEVELRDKKARWFKPHQFVDEKILVINAIVTYLDEITE